MGHLHLPYESYHEKQELPEADQRLIDRAIAAAGRAYAPYSRFHVGAAVLLQNNLIVEGNNQENAAYPSGLCAERVALFYASASHPEVPVVAIAIVAMREEKLTENPVTPCGSCRQAFMETEVRFNNPIRVIMHGTAQTLVVDTTKSLLPFKFSGNMLFND